MIINTPSEDLPRERMKKYGPSVLSDSELLAIILRTGSKGEDVLTMSKKLLNQYNLKKLSRINITSLERFLGIGEAKACQIAACFELGRRVSKSKDEKASIRNSRDVFNLIKDKMIGLNQEHLYAILVDSKRRVIKIVNLYIGSLDESVIHPREIFKIALEESAAGIILVHNHPSGDPTPSNFDIESTNNIIKAGEVLGITVIDHIIVGDGKYVSLREKDLINM